ncbi:hypothetical protein ACWEPL_07645 [Nonomuraea sp. NPDC004186]|uniref:hypothetical protein n=1 Tax=Nonomuraea sp. NPDC049625 TaxID=3155775 RepID=UPI00341BF7C5
MRKTIALAVAAVALAGCGALPGRQAGGGGEEKQPQTVAETTTEPPATAEATEAPAQETRAIASREADVSAGGQHGKARADILGLKRQGRTLSLNWSITALDGKVNVHNGLGTATLDFTVSAVSLIDPVNAKRYRVARNGTGQDAKCVCSGTQGQFLEKGQTSTLYAVFAAPPADVTKINIEMPMIGVLTDVPIS